jgi:hypothetical protein
LEYEEGLCCCVDAACSFKEAVIGKEKAFLKTRATAKTNCLLKDVAFNEYEKLNPHRLNTDLTAFYFIL